MRVIRKLRAEWSLQLFRATMNGGGIDLLRWSNISGLFFGSRPCTIDAQRGGTPMMLPQMICNNHRQTRGRRRSRDG
jgi:hypothetical protein